MLFAISVAAHGINLQDYLTSHYRIRFVERLPAHTRQRILVISNRYFKPGENYRLIRGLQPRYGMFQFIAGTIGDSAFILPIANLDETTRYLPANRDFLVYVDGHGKTFDQVLARGFELTDRFNINMLVFDWPTDYLALRKTAYVADEVAPNFVIAMNKFNVLHEKYYPGSAVSAIFHSMGNHIIKDVAGKQLLKYMPKNLFSNIILNSAAVKQANHAKWVERLNIQKEIYITINQHDKTLRGAKILRLANQLGLGYSGKPAGNAIYINFSSIETTEHNLFLGRSSVEKYNKYLYGFYVKVLHGKEMDFQNETVFQILSPSEISFRFSLR